MNQPCPRCGGDGRLPIHTMSGPPPPPCHLCRQSGTVGPTRWLQSEWDGEVHAFFDGIEAACSHSAPVDKLREAREGAVPCPRCLVIVGRMLDDRARWRS